MSINKNIKLILLVLILVIIIGFVGIKAGLFSKTGTGAEITDNQADVEKVLDEIADTLVKSVGEGYVGMDAQLVAIIESHGEELAKLDTTSAADLETLESFVVDTVPKEVNKPYVFGAITPDGTVYCDQFFESGELQGDITQFFDMSNDLDILSAMSVSSEGKLHLFRGNKTELVGEIMPVIGLDFTDSVDKAIKNQSIKNYEILIMDKFAMECVQVSIKGNVVGTFAKATSEAMETAHSIFLKPEEAITVKYAAMALPNEGGYIFVYIK